MRKAVPNTSLSLLIPNPKEMDLGTKDLKLGLIMQIGYELWLYFW